MRTIWPHALTSSRIVALLFASPLALTVALSVAARPNVTSAQPPAEQPSQPASPSKSPRNAPSSQPPDKTPPRPSFPGPNSLKPDSLNPDSLNPDTLRTATLDGPVFTDSLRAKFAKDLRGAGIDNRVAAIRELARYRSPEAVRLILQFGLRDRNAALQTAARQALAASRGHDEVELFLTEQLRQEVFAKRRGPLDYLGRLASSVGDMRSPASVASLLTLATECDASLAPTLWDALLSSLDRAGADQDAEALPALERAAAGPFPPQSPGLKKCCVDAVCRIESPRAVELLIRWLPTLEGELRGDVVSHLRRVTGQKLGPEPVAWSGWWKVQGPTFRFPDRPSVTETVEANGSPLYYYDLPVQADRLVFVLDTSKSMEAGGRKSRLAAAQEELVRTIDRLPESTRFGIVAFSSEVVAWQPRLAAASAANRAHAIAFVRAQRPAGETATYDALQAAFDMAPDVETIYFLSDGSPSAGSILAPEKLLEAIQRDNRLRRVKIHALGAFAGPQGAGPPAAGPQTAKLEEFMRKLAGENFGQFRRLD